MPVMGDVKNEPTLTNTDCVGYDFLCKENRTPSCVQFKTGDYKEPDYIEADNESHDNSSHGIFCVTGKDSDSIDIDSIFDDKVVI